MICRQKPGLAAEVPAPFPFRQFAERFLSSALAQTPIRRTIAVPAIWAFEYNASFLVSAEGIRHIFFMARFYASKYFLFLWMSYKKIYYLTSIRVWWAFHSSSLQFFEKYRDIFMHAVGCLYWSAKFSVSLKIAFAYFAIRLKKERRMQTCADKSTLAIAPLYTLPSEGFYLLSRV